MRVGTKNRSRLAISLGTLMLVILPISLWLGWVTNKARRQLHAVETVRQHGGWVHFDYEYVNDTLTPGQEPHAPRWLPHWLGDEYFREITSVSLVYDDSTGKRFDNNDFRPGVLPALERQTGLKRLLLRGAQADDEGLRHIRGLTKLVDLYIWNASEISDEGLVQLENLTNLENLHLDHSKVTDKGFLALKRLTKLKHLVLEWHCFSDRALQAVDNMPDLTWLCIGGDQTTRSLITDAGLKHVAHLKKLENLNLSYAKITDRGLDSIKGLTDLTILDLSGCEITDEGLRKLTALDKLKWLILNNTKITDQGAEMIAELPKLQLLAVSGTAVTKECQERVQLKLQGPQIRGRRQPNLIQRGARPKRDR